MKPEENDSYRQQLNQMVCEQRRKIAAVSPAAFAQIYLRKHFSLPPSVMHTHLFALLAEASEKRGARLAIAAPRGHAKSTVVSLAYLLWCICYQKEPYILLISHTASQANDLLTIIKTELTDNPLLLADFPGVCEDPSKGPVGPPRWRQDDIITRNTVRVSAYGAGKQIRGRRQRHERPSLIVLDDVEHDKTATSEVQREGLWDWMTKTVLKAGTMETNVVMVGTVLHYDSVLGKLIDPAKSPGWKGHKYQAVRAWATSHDLWERWTQVFNREAQHEGKDGEDVARAFFEQNQQAMLEGTDVLWPQREDYYALMKTRLCEGHYSFDSEKQNEPTNPEDCLFSEGEFRYWDNQYASEEELIAAVGSRGRFYGACDPSLGKLGKHHDDTAIVTLLRDLKENVLYVLDADIKRRTPEQTIQAVIEFQRRRRYTHFGIETNQFQEFLADELVKRSRQANVHVPIKKVIHTTDKLGRIQSLQPKVAAGTIRFSKRHRILLEQLRLFPMAAHDDGPDALEMAVWLVMHARTLGISIGPSR